MDDHGPGRAGLRRGVGDGPAAVDADRSGGRGDSVAVDVERVAVEVAPVADDGDGEARPGGDREVRRAVVRPQGRRAVLAGAPRYQRDLGLGGPPASVVDRVLEVRVGAEAGADGGEDGLRVRRDGDGDARLVGRSDRGDGERPAARAAVVVQDVHHGGAAGPHALGVRLGDQRRLRLVGVVVRRLFAVLLWLRDPLPLRLRVDHGRVDQENAAVGGVVEHDLAAVDPEHQRRGQRRGRRGT